MTDSGGGNDATQPSRRYQPSWIAKRVEQVKEQLQKRRADKEKESPTDRASRSTARATWAIAFLTIAMAVVGALQWSTLHDTDQSIKRQLSVMENQFVGAERPWLAVSMTPIGDFDVKDGMGSLRVSLKIKNTGHTPAISVWVLTDGYFPSTVEEIIANQESRCSFAPFSPSKRFGETIFPNEELVEETNVFFPPEEIQKGRESLKDIGLFRNPTVKVCVLYAFSFGELNPHYAVQAWQIFKKMGPDNDSRIVPNEGTISLSDLLMNSRSRIHIGARAD